MSALSAKGKLSPEARKWQKRLSSWAAIPPGCVIGVDIIRLDWWLLLLGILCFAFLRIRTIAAMDEVLDVIEEALPVERRGRGER